MDGDDLTSIQQFYDIINAVIMTHLSSNNFIRDYVDLTYKFDHYMHILTTSIHTQYNDALNICKNMSRTLLRHLHFKSIVDAQKAPFTALILQENSMIEYRFDFHNHNQDDPTTWWLCP